MLVNRKVYCVILKISRVINCRQQCVIEFPKLVLAVLVESLKRRLISNCTVTTQTTVYQVLKTQFKFSQRIERSSRCTGKSYIYIYIRLNYSAFYSYNHVENTIFTLRELVDISMKMKVDLRQSMCNQIYV